MLGNNYYFSTCGAVVGLSSTGAIFYPGEYLHISVPYMNKYKLNSKHTNDFLYHKHDGGQRLVTQFVRLVGIMEPLPEESHPITVQHC